jgi:hypothetical protein
MLDAFKTCGSSPPSSALAFHLAECALNGVVHLLVPTGVLIALVGPIAVTGGRALARRVTEIARRRRLRHRLAEVADVRAGRHRHHLVMVPRPAGPITVWADSRVVDAFKTHHRIHSGHARTPAHVGRCAERSARLVAHLVIAEADPKLIEEANALARHLRGLHDALNERSSR